LRGSRLVPLGEWLAAERKWVKEGSTPYYWSGFHAYMSLADVGKWLHRCRITKGRVAVEVDAAEIRPKPTAGRAVLAGRIRVTREQWAKRIALHTINLSKNAASRE